MTGLEPANGGITTHCLNHLATPAYSIYDSIKTEKDKVIFGIKEKLIIENILHFIDAKLRLHRVSLGKS